MFYESQHPLAVDFYKILCGQNLCYGDHMHYCYELVIITDGTLNITVDTGHYQLHSGDAALIFPNQLHGFHTENECHYILCLFSPELVGFYWTKVSSRIPQSNLFRCDPYFAEKLRAVSPDDSILTIKGILYSLCGEFDRDRKYTAFENTSQYLLFHIFRFVEKNYCHTCTLAELSGVLGYDYNYLSSYFKKHTGNDYADYVRQYRLKHACYLLRESDLPIMQIARECGFVSHRTFTRSFQATNGMTPADYRKQHQRKQE